MAKINYWVVSPNVRNDTKDVKVKVERWKQASRLAHAAFMGYWPDEYNSGKGQGPRFAGDPKGKIRNGHVVNPGDVILIARHYKKQPEFVGFGVVKGKHETKNKHAPDAFGSLRHLDPFKNCPPPPPLPGKWFLNALPGSGKALFRLKPDNPNHKKVCDWMDWRLKQAVKKPSVAIKPKHERKSEDERIVIADLAKNPQLGFTFQRKRQRGNAIRKETKLVEDYRKWLKERNRKLKQVKCGRLLCDGYETEGKKLIEAKSSSSREHIRMAVGQLLDYAFQAKKKPGVSDMAILLPEKPKLERVKWLQPLRIKIIWRREDGSFSDNANGQFTEGS